MNFWLRPWVVWLSGNVVGRINQVTLRRARLVLRRVTVREYVVLMCNQPLRPLQPPIISSTEREMSTDKGLVAVPWDRKGSRRSGVALAMTPWCIHLQTQWPNYRETSTPPTILSLDGWADTVGTVRTEIGGVSICTGHSS